MVSSKNLALVSMLLGVSSLLFFPGIIIIEVWCKIEPLPLNYTVMGNAAVISAIWGFGFGLHSKEELRNSQKSTIIYKIMSVIGIICSIIMIILMVTAIILMYLEERQIFKISL